LAGDTTTDEEGTGTGSGRETPAGVSRFLGVQWRYLVSHLEVAVGAALLGAVLVGGAVAAGRGPGVVALLGLVALLLAVVGGTWVGLRSARSVKLRLREASRFAAALARGDYRWRISLPPSEGGRLDEIDLLGEELNAMADSLEAAIVNLRALADRNQALAEEAGRLAALEERTRLARDLHDTVNQQVFSLSMQAAAARRRLGALADPSPAIAEVLTLLAEVEEMARSAHRQIRDLILELRPTTLEQQGLGPALEEYVRSFAASEGLESECRLECTGRFGPAVEEALFRIAQEALNNVAKHSGARRVSVRLALDPARWVVLTVRDDGRGFDTSAPVRATALGLRGIEERVRALGGRWRVESSPGRGTTLEASFPTGTPLPGVTPAERSGNR